MGTTLYGNNRKNGNLTLNEMGKAQLDYLAWGLKQKHGVYAPMSKEDCQILARILHNKAIWLGLGPDQVRCVQEAFNIYMRYGTQIEYMTESTTVAWIHEVATWFENCGGLRSPEGYHEE